MSGGTFELSGYQLSYVADVLRQPSDDDDSWRNPLGAEQRVPQVDAFMADLLDLTGDLLRQVDYHYASDSDIYDEKQWLDEAKARLDALTFTPPTAPEATS